MVATQTHNLYQLGMSALCVVLIMNIDASYCCVERLWRHIIWLFLYVQIYLVLEQAMSTIPTEFRQICILAELGNTVPTLLYLLVCLD